MSHGERDPCAWDGEVRSAERNRRHRRARTSGCEFEATRSVGCHQPNPSDAGVADEVLVGVPSAASRPTQDKSGLFVTHLGAALFVGDLDRVGLWRELGYGYCLPA